MSSLPGSPEGPPWRETPVSRASLYMSFWIPSNGALRPGSPNKSPTERDAPILEPSLNYLSKFPVKRTSQPAPPSLPGFTTEPPGGDRQSFPEPSSTHPLIKTKSHRPSMSPVRVHLPYSPNRVPMERDDPSSESVVYSFIYICQSSQLRSPATKLEENIRSPSKKPHAYGHTMVCGLVPAVTTPVPCSLQHDTFHVGLGRPASH